MARPLRLSPRRRRRLQAGFSLVELGIVIAVIAVLGVVVIASKGYIDAAKKNNAIELVRSIRSAAQQFALRHHNGVAFASQSASRPEENISLKALITGNFLPDGVRTPWDDGKRIVIIVEADSGQYCHSLGGGTKCDKCAGFACLKVEFPVPDDQICEDMRSYFEDKAVAVGCSAGTFKISTR